MNFLFPAGLALSGLAVPLVALYFLRLRRRKVRVSSLLPWHALQKSEQLSSPFHRFRRNLLLLVQLLLLALLVLAFARPTLETGSAEFRSVVLLVDTSASMGATDTAPNRLARAVAEADRIVSDLGPGDEVMVVSAGPRTAVVLPFTRDNAAARSALADLVVTEAEGGLVEGMELAASLARSRSQVQIVVLSDGGPEDLPAITGISAEDVQFVRIGESDTNAGIVALDLRRSPVSELDRQLFVTVRSFGSEPVDGAVEVYLDDGLLALRNTRLDPEVPVSMVFDLPLSAEGVLKVHLDVDPDQLPADDTAWAVLSTLGAREILLVGGDALLARILANDPRIRASRIAPAAATPEILAAADAVLFAGAVPEGVDGLDYAVLGPFPGTPIGLGDPVKAPRITGWQRTHPILRFTRWDDVVVGTARTVTDKGGLSTLVDAEHGPLVLAGQRNGGRVVQLAFDPLESDLPLRVGWPILVMNIVGWLTEDPLGGEASQARTGTPFVQHLGEADARAIPTVRGPGPAEAVVTGGTLRVTRTDRVGVYDVTAGGTRLRFAANLLSERESRIRPRSALGLVGSAGEPVRASLAVSRRELWRPLLIAAAALLVLEWLFWNLRRTA